MKAPASLAEYSTVWHDKLRECQYVGEIYLDNEDLFKLAQEYHSARNTMLSEGTYKAALVVLAVNCAYHYYDDQGFWIHYCRLIQLENTPANKDYHGATIENKLRELNLLKVERNGPFRYVGAILEQCGVSKKYIKQLSRIVNELKTASGWAAFHNLTLREFQIRVASETCSLYLKNFLLDREGWLFTMQAGYLASLYETGVMDLLELKQLPGYQPDFWPDFLLGFQTEKTNELIRKSVSKPRLRFIKSDCSFALHFPSLQHARGVIKPFQKVNWVYPETGLASVDMWSETYSGEVLTKEGQSVTWITVGWIPDGEPVLFEINTGLIPRGTYLSPGDYILIAPESFAVTYKIKHSFGAVKFPFTDKYMAYLVDIEADAIVQGYKFSFSGTTVPKIEWLEPEKYMLPYANSPVDVFSGQLPPLSVSDFEAIENNTIGLFYDTGRVTGRIRNEDDIERFREHASRCLPFKGSIWMSVISRSRFVNYVPPAEVISFCLLPEIDFQYDERLYGLKEDVTISVIGNDSVSVEFNNCDPDQGSTTSWHAGYRSDFAEGVIQFGEYCINIKIPVIRARLLDSNSSMVTYFTESDVSTREMRVTGMPESKVVIQFLESQASLSLHFEKQGFDDIPSDEFKKLTLAASSHCHELMINTEGRAVSTGAIYINIDSIKESLFTGQPFNFAINNAKALEQTIALCASIVRKPPGKIILDKKPAFHPEIDALINTMLACAAVFDDTEVIISGETLNWFEEVTVSAETRLLLAHYLNDSECCANHNIYLIPDVKRWQELLSEQNYKNTEPYRLELLNQWSAELLSNKANLRSELAALPGAPVLNAAWLSYLENNLERSTGMLNNAVGTNSLVKDLMLIIKLISYLRLARFKAAAETLPDTLSTVELMPYIETIRVILHYINSSAWSQADTGDLSLAPVLPLTGSDLELLKTLNRLERSESVDSEIIGLQEMDWLYLYTMLNRPGKKEEKKHLALKLTTLIDSIPSSPEKAEITGKINTYLGS